jgi:hypothetical protein
MNEDLMPAFALTFSIATDTKELDKHEADEENSDPYADVDVVIPEFDGDTSRCQFYAEIDQSMQGPKFIEVTYQKEAQ